MRKVILILGTRPEAIKVLPVVRSLREKPDDFQTVVCSTGQHREMLDPILRFFSVTPDVELSLMRPNQTLASFTAAAVEQLDAVYSEQQPSAVLVQGDTTSAFAGALAAFYRKIPVGHIEAGLRSGDVYSPFPEEMNRLLIGRIARWHFAPTRQNLAALEAEGVKAGLYETGNTVIDALFWARELLQDRPDSVGLPEGLRPELQTVLMTCHRRESFGDPLRRILEAVRTFVDQQPKVQVVYPVHLNPNVLELARSILGGHDRILLTHPMDYPQLVAVMDRCRFILTDSGGLQEEGPAIGKPVIVLREVTERTEAIEAGRAVLVGADPKLILEWCGKLTEDEALFKRMSQPYTPYLAGSAANRIRDALFLEMQERYAP